jgi:mycothiol synthase
VSQPRVPGLDPQLQACAGLTDRQAECLALHLNAPATASSASARPRLSARRSGLRSCVRRPAASKPYAHRLRETRPQTTPEHGGFTRPSRAAHRWTCRLPYLRRQSCSPGPSVPIVPDGGSRHLDGVGKSFSQRAVRHYPRMTRLRPLRESDVEQVVAIYRRAFGDERPIDAAEILSWLRNTEISPESLCVLEEDGLVAGYGDLWIGETDVALEVAAPNRWGVFLQWAEETARANAAERVRVLDYARESGLAAAAAARGYSLWRSAFIMRIDFGTTSPSAAALPSGVTLSTFREEDGDRLRAVLNEVFAPDPFFDELSREQFREFFLLHCGIDPSLWLLARDTAGIVGFVLAFPEWMGDPTAGRIKSLGVREHWRRRGVGEAMLRNALHALHVRGLDRATLGVDTSDETGALRLYERAGMWVERRLDNWALDL